MHATWRARRGENSVDSGFEKHARVIAIREVGYGKERTEKGTRGVVVAVNDPFFGSKNYDVMFDTNVIVSGVRADDLYPEAGVPGPGVR